MTRYDIATPYTAVFVVLRKDNKIAMVLRRNTDWMNNHYGLIQGKVEKGEPFSLAAIREAKEEAGVDVALADLKFLLVAHRNAADSLWVDMVFEAQKWQGEPHNAEPEKASELAWFDPANLPANTIPDMRYYIESLEAGKNYVEYGWED